jgi:hypothetical protein
VVTEHSDDARVRLVQENIQRIALENNMEPEIEQGGAVQKNFRLSSRLEHDLRW